MPLFPGEVTNLTMNVAAGATPTENCLCCYMVLWFERRAQWRELRDRAANWALGLLDISWPLWQRERESLTNGIAFASNIKVAGYFRQMHGFTREQWLEELARMRSATAAGDIPERVRYPYESPAEEWKRVLDSQAREAFADFCRCTTDANNDSGSPASPDRTSPKR